MVYIYQYDIAALFIIITVFLHFFFKKTINTWQTRTFSILIVLAFLSNVADLFTIITISYPDTVATWGHYVVNIFYLTSFNATSAVYFAYVAILTNKNRTLSHRDHLCFVIPLLFDIVLITTSPLTKAVFYMGKNKEYIHGKWFMALYVVAFYFVLFALAKTLKHRKQMNKSQIASALFYTIASLVALAVQVYYTKLLIVQFTVAIAVLLIYLAMENPEDYMDKQFGTYNHLAFMEVFEGLANRDKVFSVLGIQVDGLKYINENLGFSTGNRLMKEVADYLLTRSSHMKVFHMSGAQFVISGTYPKQSWDLLISDIREKFSKPFVIDGLELSLSASLCMLTYPETVNSLEDAIDMIDYSLGEARTSSEEIVVYADKEILEKGKRENLIISVLTQAIREDKFEIHYQPIYSVEKERFTTAEALVRLQTPELGYISPEEFIPIAEKNGLILSIGKVVFNDVCRFFKENKLEELGMEYIHINLSVVECMQERLYEKLIEIVDSYGLDHKYISLEITETAAIVSKDTLKNNMDKLIEAGCKFSLDDYGTGFSNTSTLINYPFAEIKIDKSMIWGAMEDKKAYVALKHSMSMIKELNMDIVAEGVENLEQAEMLKELGCDFFQGFYYSKPLVGEAFIKKIKE